MFAIRIKNLRQSRELNQVQLAEKLGVKKQSISNWENDNIMPSIEMLIRIADFFHVSTDYLLGADSGYLGSTNLNGKYLGDVTMHDVVFDLQKLNAKDRRDLLKYIRFLKNSD